MLCKGFDRKWFEKGHEMHSGYKESRTGLRVKKAPSLDRFEIASKSKIKLKERVKA
jgi:hypothetical protein